MSQQSALTEMTEKIITEAIKWRVLNVSNSHGDDRKNNYPVTQIHRTSMKYDFDPDAGRGKGLILGEIDDEACIL